MKMHSVKQWYIDQLFRIHFFSIVINPFFIIRKGLIRSIQKYSSYMKGSMLDFGCGRKPYQSLFRASEYIGLDIQDKGHAHTHELIDVWYDGVKIPFSDNRFDSIFSSEVLEHVPNVSTILSEWNRVLKPGGYILLTTPFVWDEHEIPYDFSRYTTFGIEQMLCNHGFTITHKEKTTHYFETLAQMCILYIYRLLPHIPMLRMLGIVCIIFPIQSILVLLSYIVPRRTELYHNVIIVAQKL